MLFVQENKEKSTHIGNALATCWQRVGNTLATRCQHCLHQQFCFYFSFFIPPRQWLLHTMENHANPRLATLVHGGGGGRHLENPIYNQMRRSWENLFHINRFLGSALYFRPLQVMGNRRGKNQWSRSGKRRRRRRRRRRRKKEEEVD